MRKLESIEDEMQGRSTYALGDGRLIQFYIHDIRDHGLETLLKAHGIEAPNERIPVLQDGKIIGTVPGTFDPIAIKSQSFFYDPRPGDFKRTSEGWEASRQLGPGDVHAVPGFEWSNAERNREMEVSRGKMDAVLLQAVTGMKP